MERLVSSTDLPVHVFILCPEFMPYDILIGEVGERTFWRRPAQLMCLTQPSEIISCSEAFKQISRLEEDHTGLLCLHCRKVKKPTERLDEMKPLMYDRFFFLFGIWHAKVKHSNVLLYKAISYCSKIYNSACRWLLALNYRFLQLFNITI